MLFFYELTPNIPRSRNIAGFLLKLTPKIPRSRNIAGFLDDGHNGRSTSSLLPHLGGGDFGVNSRTSFSACSGGVPF